MVWKVVLYIGMQNTLEFRGKDSTPAWHVGAQAFLALLIVLLVPLTLNIKGVITSLMSQPKLAVAPKVEKKIPAKNTTLTRFLGAALFGVGEEGIIVNPETGVETIVLPYGGESEAGGVLEGSGNVDIDRWAGAPPASDGSIPEIRKPTKLRNVGGDILVGDLNGGGNAGAGGNISAGGTISAGGSI